MHSALDRLTYTLWSMPDTPAMTAKQPTTRDPKTPAPADPINQSIPPTTSAGLADMNDPEFLKLDPYSQLRRLRGEVQGLLDLINSQGGAVLTHDSLGKLADSILATRVDLEEAIAETAKADADARASGEAYRKAEAKVADREATKAQEDADKQAEKDADALGKSSTAKADHAGR